MATLNFGEKRKLEEYLGMGSGYVLNFSDRTFREFVHDSLGMDIDVPNIGGVGSKARRLRHFWTTQPDYVVGKLLKDLVESVEPDSEEFGAIRYGTPRPPALREACLKIADRLLQSAPVGDTTVISVLSKREEFDRLANGVLDSINKNNPESGLDRLHTFTMAFIRSLCEKHGIKVDKGKPLHSVYGEYVKKLKEFDLIESPMTERILKSSISVLDYFNDVRNNKSLAHDNPVLNRNESLLIFQHVTSVIRFLWTIDQGHD
jgi:Abortive infection C-terminus